MAAGWTFRREMALGCVPEVFKSVGFGGSGYLGCEFPSIVPSFDYWHLPKSSALSGLSSSECRISVDESPRVTPLATDMHL